MIKLKTLAAAALMIAAPLASHAADLIVNGSFESPVLNNGSWTILASMPGWSADATSGVELRRNVAGTAQDGQQFVELDTNGGNFNGHVFDNSTNSSIWQDVVTGNGQSYTLSYFYSPRAGVAANSNDISVYWNNTLLQVNAGSGIGQGNHVWQQFSFNVMGTGADRVTFAAGGRQDSLGGSLDNVSLNTNVPEPGTYALLLAGLGAVGFVARRRSA